MGRRGNTAQGLCKCVVVLIIEVVIMKNFKSEVYECDMSVGISSTPAFEEKGLATHAVNTGTKCNNDCYYCYVASLPIRMHKSFKQHGLVASEFGYAIIDPDKPEKVATDARKFKGNAVVQLCTYTDAWSPAARKYGLGRKLLKAVLENNSKLTVRLLTKNHQVEDDFELIEQYKDRVQVGLSLTATKSKSKIMKVVEPNASPNIERMRVMKKAHKMGLRTFGMLCPLLPSIADNRQDIDELVKFCEEIGCEEIFSEALNSRAKGLVLTRDALSQNRYYEEAQAIQAITKRNDWSKYAFDLIKNVQSSMREYSDISKLKFLLYPKGLVADHREQIENDDAGIKWL
jgi:DNA repair photolyase